MHRCVQALHKLCMGSVIAVQKCGIFTHFLNFIVTSGYKTAGYTQSIQLYSHVFVHTKCTHFLSGFGCFYTLSTAPTIITTKLNI